MKISILGGGGFIGSSLIKGMLNNGYCISVLDCNSPLDTSYLDNKNICWFVGNAKNLLDVQKCIKGAEWVIDLASPANPRSVEENFLSSFATECHILTTILTAMKLEGVSKLIYASSGGTVYGDSLNKGSETRFKESDPVMPISGYGLLKFSAENLLLTQSEKFNIKPTVLRISNPYGDGQDSSRKQGVIGVFMDKAIKNESIDVWGDGSIARDFLYTSDLIEAFQKCIERNVVGQVINIGSGVSSSILEVIDCIERVTKRKIPINFHPSRSFDVKANILNVDKALALLGWAPSISIAEGIEKLHKKLMSL